MESRPEIQFETRPVRNHRGEVGVQTLWKKGRVALWVAIPAIVIGVHFAFGGGPANESPLLMAGGLVGLSGLTLLSERWRPRLEGMGRSDEGPASSLPDDRPS
jgi:hypothetical protein